MVTVRKPAVSEATTGKMTIQGLFVSVLGLPDGHIHTPTPSRKSTKKKTSSHHQLWPSPCRRASVMGQAASAGSSICKQ